MKRCTYLLLFLVFIIVSSCKKTDTGSPIITLKGSNPYVVVWGSAKKYADPGAVATDAVDGEVDYSIDSTVNMYSAGSYIVTFTATDAAGNKTSATRTVIVDAAPYLKGIFTVKNYIGIVFDSDYTDTLSIATDTTNYLKFKSFAAFKNAKVHATFSGTSVSIPQQEVLCGVPARNRTFSGYGTFASDTAFVISYTISDTTATYTGHGVYKRID